MKIKKILHPKNYVLIIGLFSIIFSLIYLIYFKKFGTSISYILYLLMTYFFVVICIKIFNVLKNKINIIISNNKYLSKYKNDYKLRYKISLFLSLIINIFYALFKLIVGFSLKSIWFISYALYYILLIILRTNIALQVLKDNISLKDEYIKYRTTAIILLFTNVILTIIVLIIVNQKIMNIYPSWIAISIAVYTFYLIFMSIYNLIKYRKYKSPLVTSTKVINVVTSLVSIISLEIVLIPTFEEEKTFFFEIMIISTGGFLAIVIVIISLYIIIKSTEWLNSN